MAYAGYAAVQRRVKWTFTPDQITQCGELAQDMSDYIDGWFASLFAVPFAAPYPGLVVEACILLTAGEFLMAEMVNHPQMEVVQARAADYHIRGQALIDKLVANSSLLTGANPELRADDETGIGPQMNTVLPTGSVTLQDSSTWRRPIPSVALQSRPGPEEYP